MAPGTFRLRDCRALKRVYRPLIAAFLRVAPWTLRRMPRRLALTLGEGMGLVASNLVGRDRRLAVAHLRLAFGRTKSGRELARVARESWRNVGRSLAETLRLPAMTAEEIVSLVDADSFGPAERALARGKGMLVLSAHAGAWELLAAYLAIRLGKPFHTIGRRLYFGPYNDMLLDARRSAGVETLFQDAGARGALQVLHGGGALGILADLDMPRLAGGFVDFFGRPAWTSTGPAALARASGAGMVPFFISWERGRRHRVHVLPEVEIVKTRDGREDAVGNTRAWARVTEGFVRRRPEQWVWFHRRWRTRPAKARDGQDGNKR